jgi:predicted transcriptional regulator
MSLKNFCRKPLVRVAPETNITEACRLMEQNNVGSVVNVVCGSFRAAPEAAIL